MRIRFPCLECHAIYKDELTLVHLQDNDVYELTCPVGHQTTVRLANEKFELLFDSGGLAVLDGYLYEAVSSLAVALERFREFYIRVIALKHLGGNESKVEQLTRILSGKASEPLEQTWKKVKQQSERQYGAFLFLYLLETGNPPQSVDEIHMESYRGKDNKKKPLQHFRNSVIHGGYIPTMPQVKEYGDHVFQFIKSILSELRANNASAMEQFTIYNSMIAHQQSQTLLHKVQLIPTMLSSSISLSGGPPSFDEALVSLKEQRKRVYS